MTDVSNGTNILTEEAENALRDLQRIAAREPAQRVIERVGGDLTFEQQNHTLLTEMLDKIAQSWVEQLKRIRNNTEQLESLVMQTCGKAQNDINELHILGITVMQEAKRGEETCAVLTKQLDKIIAAQ